MEKVFHNIVAKGIMGTGCLVLSRYFKV
jgi:hypothetical protein